MARNRFMDWAQFPAAKSHRIASICEMEELEDGGTGRCRESEQSRIRAGLLQFLTEEN